MRSHSALTTTGFNSFNPYNFQRGVEANTKSEFEIAKISEVTIKYMKLGLAGTKLRWRGLSHDLKEMIGPQLERLPALSTDAKMVPLAAVAMMNKKVEDITSHDDHEGAEAQQELRRAGHPGREVLVESLGPDGLG